MRCPTTISALLLTVSASLAATVSGSQAGIDFSKWVNVNGAAGTWRIADGVLHGSGAPSGYLRSDQQYENYVFELEWFNVNGIGGPVLYLHADALPARGAPFPRSLRVGNDISSPLTALVGVFGAKIRNDRIESSGKRQLYVWNTYRIESNNGVITIRLNGQLIAKGINASLRKGYICISAAGPELTFRKAVIQELPASDLPATAVAETDKGFLSLYRGPDLADWDLLAGHKGHWTGKDWLIDYDGKSEEKDKCLWTRKAYRDFVLMADVRFTREPQLAHTPVVLPDGSEARNEDGTVKEVELPYFGDTGIYLRGHSKNQVNIGNRYVGSGEIYGYRADKKMPPEVRAGVVPTVKADRPAGEWNRFVITMSGNRISVVLNDTLVIDNALLPGIQPEGRIALQDDHWDNNTFQFANLFIKEL